MKHESACGFFPVSCCLCCFVGVPQEVVDHIAESHPTVTRMNAIRNPSGTSFTFEMKCQIDESSVVLNSMDQSKEYRTDSGILVVPTPASSSSLPRWYAVLTIEDKGFLLYKWHFLISAIVMAPDNAIAISVLELSRERRQAFNCRLAFKGSEREVSFAGPVRSVEEGIGNWLNGKDSTAFEEGIRVSQAMFLRMCEKQRLEEVSLSLSITLHMR
jgi:hypothetical protein